MSRPERTWLGDQPGPIEMDLTQFGERGRVVVRQPGRGLVSWLAKDGGGTAVVELAEAGRLVFRAWSGFGERLVDHQQSLAALLPDTDAEVELLALRERFLWNKLESGGRLDLSERELRHLDITEGEDFLVVCTPAKIEIWNWRYREAFRSLATKSLRYITMDPSY